MGNLASTPLWIASSLLVAGLQFAVVLYNVAVMFVDLGLFWLAGLTRWALEWVAVLFWPCSLRTQWRIAHARRQLDSARTAEEYERAADTLDVCMGLQVWRGAAEDPAYDAGLMARAMEDMATARRRHDYGLLAGTLTTALHRQFAGMDSPGLYYRAYGGTKRLIDMFLDECVESIEALCNSPEPGSCSHDPSAGDDGGAGSSDEEGGTSSSSASAGAFADVSPHRRCHTPPEDEDDGADDGGASLSALSDPQSPLPSPSVGPTGVETSTHHRLLTVQEKAEFLESARLSMGRTALCLSGGGSLSMYHMGVCSALMRAGCMPRVVSGTSGGSIVAAMLAMRTDEEMVSDVIKPDIAERFGVTWFDPLPVQVQTFVRTLLTPDEHSRMMESDRFAHTCRQYFGAWTFADAFRHTRRIANIVVTVRYGGSSASHPLTLNYLTAPRVYLWSAVAASCALPGLMPPTALRARARSARSPFDGLSPASAARFSPPAQDPPEVEVAFHMPGVALLDGSIHSDIPTEPLARMFHVNRFIVSQVNPHVAPFLREDGPDPYAMESQAAAADAPVPMERHPVASGSHIGLRSLLTQARFWLSLDVQHRAHRLAKLRLLPRVFGHEIAGVFLQKYRGDVTITPRMSLLDKFKATSHPTRADMVRYISQGQRAAWAKLAHIRSLVIVEKALSRAARRYPVHRLAHVGRAGRLPALEPPSTASLSVEEAEAVPGLGLSGRSVSARASLSIGVSEGVRRGLSRSGGSLNEDDASSTGTRDTPLARDSASTASGGSSGARRRRPPAHGRKPLLRVALDARRPSEDSSVPTSGALCEGASTGAPFTPLVTSSTGFETPQDLALGDPAGW